MPFQNVAVCCVGCSLHLACSHTPLPILVMLVHVLYVQYYDKVCLVCHLREMQNLMCTNQTDILSEQTDDAAGFVLGI